MLDLEKNSKLPLWQIPEAIAYNPRSKVLGDPREWDLIKSLNNYSSKYVLTPRTYTIPE